MSYLQHSPITIASSGIKLSLQAPWVDLHNLDPLLLLLLGRLGLTPATVGLGIGVPRTVTAVSCPEPFEEAVCEIAVAGGAAFARSGDFTRCPARRLVVAG